MSESDLESSVKSIQKDVHSLWILAIGLMIFWTIIFAAATIFVILRVVAEHNRW